MGETRARFRGQGRIVGVVIDRELIAVLRGAQGRALLEREGIVPQEMTPDELAAHVKVQLDTWGRAIREAGIPQE